MKNNKMTNCGDCGKEIIITEETKVCDGCGEPLCDDCYSKNDGFCNDCLVDLHE